MKYFLTFCSVIMFLNSSTAQKTKYEQLLSVNEQWENHLDINISVKEEPAKILSEKQLIQQHLKETEILLRSRSVKHFNKIQQKTEVEIVKCFA